MWLCCLSQDMRCGFIGWLYGCCRGMKEQLRCGEGAMPLSRCLGDSSNQMTLGQGKSGGLVEKVREHGMRKEKVWDGKLHRLSCHEDEQYLLW